MRCAVTSAVAAALLSAAACAPSGTVEFVDPADSNRVLGRFPVSVATRAQGRLVVLGDRQMMVSEEFGRAVCKQAFRRNPRKRGLHNATRCDT